MDVKGNIETYLLRTGIFAFHSYFSEVKTRERDTNEPSMSPFCSKLLFMEES